MSENTKNLQCPRCGDKEKIVLPNKLFKCKNCELVYSEEMSNLSNLRTDNASTTDEQEEDGKEDSQADGLMTLGDDDILFPEEF